MTGPKIKPKLTDTYVDGVGADRCTHCQSVLRHGGEPMVVIRRVDAETLAQLLDHLLSVEGIVPELLLRLEQAVGRTVRQMEAEK